MAPDLIHDPDDAQGSSPEALLQVLSHHRQRSQRRGQGRGLRARRRTIAVLVAVAAVALLGASVLIWGNFTHLGPSGHPAATGTESPPSRTGTSKQRHHAHTTPAQAGRGDKPKNKKPTPPPPKAIHVILTAARSDSWVEVRLGSSTGRVLFDGVVPEGQSVRVAGRRLWARFGSLGNFDVTVNGRAVHPTLNGTVDTVITASAIEPAPAQTG